MDQGFEELLLVVLGGLLATLSPGIVDAISRRKRRGEFARVLSTELQELRFLLALVLLRVHRKLRALDQDALSLIRPVVEEYKGHADDNPLLDTTRELLAKGDSAFIAVYNAPGGDSTGIWPVPYHVPYLESHLNDLGLVSEIQQRCLLRVISEVGLFNEQVSLVQRGTDRSFEGLSPTNHAINDANLSAATEKLATRASELIRAINRVIDAQGRPH